jgi:hypothetical protein
VCIVAFIQYTQRFFRPIHGPEREVQHSAICHGRQPSASSSCSIHRAENPVSPEIEQASRKAPDASNSINVWFAYHAMFL